MKHKLTIKTIRKKTYEVLKEETESFFSIYNLDRRLFEIEDKYELSNKSSACKELVICTVEKLKQKESK